MSWNYRVVKYPENGTGIPTYGIHEAYYSEDGVVTSITQWPSGLSFEHLQEYKNAIERFNEAFDKPILDYDTLKEIDETIPEHEDE